MATSDRTRLIRARENGYLDAAGRPQIVAAHAFWCWRLRVPAIWYERKSPRSKYGQLHLELYTTGRLLTEQGQNEMTDLLRKLHLPGRVTVSGDDAHWEDVPRQRLEELARTVLRIATRMGNYELRRGTESVAETKNVLLWKRSA